MQKKQRVYFGEYDFVRVIAAVAVVWIHVAALLVLSTPVGSKSWWLGNMIDSAARWSVPVFIMLSGALMIRPVQGDISFHGLGKRLIRIGMPLITWSLVYFVFLAAVISKEPITADFRTWVFQLFAGNPFPGHLYFLFILAGLYVITPVLNALVPLVRTKTLWQITAGILAATSLTHIVEVWILRGGMPVNALTQWLPYLGYYLLGYAIHTHVLSNNSVQFGLRRLGVTSLIMIFLIGGSSFMLASSGHLALDSKGLYFYEFLNPIVIVLSVTTWLFLVAFYKKYLTVHSQLIHMLSSLTFGVYLAHLLILMAANKGFDALQIAPLARTLVLLIAVPLASFIAVACFSWVMITVNRTRSVKG